MVGFRGGRLGGLAAISGLDFHEKSRFLQFLFCVWGDALESPGVAFGVILARFGAVSMRSGPSFGVFPS